MPTAIHREAAELVLASMFRESETGYRASFLIQRPGQPMWAGGLGTDLFYERREFVRAILYIRKHGAPYLRFLSVSDIWSMLTSFVSGNYWILSKESFATQFDGSYASFISDPTKVIFADALSASTLFAPSDKLTLFPLVPITVETAFDSAPFFFVPAGPGFGASRLPAGVREEWVPADQFPPEKEFKGRIEMPTSWLGIRSPEYKAAEKMKAAILGALALTPMPRLRYSFSGCQMFGGRATITDGITMSFGDPHTPPMMNNIVLTERDQPWLAILAKKLTSETKVIKRQLRALEYYYRAWPLSESERFPIMCMTLDAVFGDASHATQAVIDGVRATIGGHVEDPRLRALMELRAAVIHGGAPDVYDSRKYARYYDAYGADPIRDLDLVVGQCLRHHVFGEAMIEHPDPNAAKIAALQASGKLPKLLSDPSILDEIENDEESIALIEAEESPSI